MKKIKVHLGLIFLVVLCGCNNRQEPLPEVTSSTTPKVTIAVFETKEELKLPTVIPVPTEEGNKEEHEKETEILQGLKDTVADYEEDVSLYNAMNGKSSKNLNDSSSLFVVYPESGSIYYVNQQKDFYLYRIADDKMELAVELPVMELCVYGQDIYFMLNSYEKYDLGNRKTGDIYCYSPLNGTVKLVYKMHEADSARAYKMLVNDNGIYFRYLANSKEMVDGVQVTKAAAQYFYLAFNASEAVTDEERTIDAAYPVGGSVYRYCIVNDKQYYFRLDDTSIIVNDMPTGECMEYELSSQVDEVLKKEGSSLEKAVAKEGFIEFISDFTVTEQGRKLWVAAQGMLYGIDTETGKVFLGETIPRGYKKLYTDGNNVYCVYVPDIRQSSVTKLAKIYTEKLVEYKSEIRTGWCFELQEIN